MVWVMCAFGMSCSSNRSIWSLPLSTQYDRLQSFRGFDFTDRVRTLHYKTVPALAVGLDDYFQLSITSDRTGARVTGGRPISILP